MKVIRDIVYLYPAQWREIKKHVNKSTSDAIGSYADGNWHADVLLPLGGFSKSAQNDIEANLAKIESPPD